MLKTDQMKMQLKSEYFPLINFLLKTVETKWIMVKSFNKSIPPVNKKSLKTSGFVVITVEIIF